MSCVQAAKFLRVAAIFALILGGLLFASGAHPSIDAFAVWTFDLLDWPLGDASAALTQEARLLSGIGGGLSCGLGAMFYFVVAPLVAEGNRTAIRGALISIFAWFVVDSAGSIAAGAPSNAVFNLIFLALFAGPLLAARPASAAA